MLLPEVQTLTGNEEKPKSSGEDSTLLELSNTKAAPLRRRGNKRKQPPLTKTKLTSTSLEDDTIKPDCNPIQEKVRKMEPELAEEPEADAVGQKMNEIEPEVEEFEQRKNTIQPEANESDHFDRKTNGTSHRKRTGDPETGDSPSGLWPHLLGVAQIWRFSGALPLEGLGLDCRRGLRFRWRCWTTAYTLVLRLIGTLVQAFIYLELVRLRAAMGLSRLDLYFHVLRSGLILLLILVQNVVLMARVKRFPPLMRRWQRTDAVLHSLRGRSGAHVRRQAWTVCGFMMVVTTIINGILAFHATQICFGPVWSWSARAAAVFATTLVSGLFYMRVLYINIEFTYVFARGLQAGFRKVRANLEKRLRRPPTACGKPLEAVVEVCRLEYVSVCSLVGEVDKLCSASALTTVCMLFAAVYANVYNCIIEARGGHLNFALLTNLVFAAGAMTGLMVMFFEGSRIRSEARNIITFLQRAKFSHLCIRDQMQLQFWVSSSTHSLPCLTAWGLFPLTREAGITIVGVVATYVTILLQFQMQSPKVDASET